MPARSPKPNRGGARPGAGRKRRDTGKILLSPPRDVVEAMQADKVVRKRGLDALVQAVRASPGAEPAD